MQARARFLPCRPGWLVPLLSILTLTPGCRDDVELPTAPETQPALAAAAATTLVFRQVSAGGGHSCGITTDDRAFCWGGNDGEVGDGTAIQRLQPVPVSGGLRFRSISAGLGHTCGITTDDRALCWGSNSSGQIGDGTAERTLHRLEPVPVLGGLAFREVSAGHSHTCGRTTENVVYCWGANLFGQLGDGTTTDHLTPVPVAGTRRFRQVSAGYQHTCALTTAGVAYCWGRNRFAQIGDSSTATLRRRPTKVAGGHVFRQLDAGGFHTCAVTAENRAWCWGEGRFGAIGDGKALLRFEPRAVAGGHSFSRVVAGGEHTCGETTANKLYCWGENGHGQLGVGTLDGHLKPVAVLGGLTFAQASMGDTHTCARTVAGVAWCWGFNDYGQLGDGTRSERLAPVLVAAAP